MKRAILSLSLIILVGLARLQAHAFLDHAIPAVGSELKQQPREVRIWFTEPIVAGSSSIKVFGPNGKQIDKKDTRAGANNNSLIRVSLPLLVAGSYKVAWSVVSVDGHRTTGDFSFRVSPQS